MGQGQLEEEGGGEGHAQGVDVRVAAVVGCEVSEGLVLHEGSQLGVGVVGDTHHRMCLVLFTSQHLGILKSRQYKRTLIPRIQYIVRPDIPMHDFIIMQRQHRLHRIRHQRNKLILRPLPISLLPIRNNLM